MSYHLGIDVGTSFTAAAIRDDTGTVSVIGLGPIADSIPTVLYLDADGGMLAGDAANRRALLDPTGAAREFKRRLGDPTPIFLRGSPFSAESLIARILAHVVERVVDRQRERPRSIAITHPANWGPYKLELFGQALRLADLEDALLITEPAAAAASFAMQTRVASGSIIAVYDLGGGTFDAAVLRKNDQGFEVLGEPVGLEHLGGVDFDEVIMEYVRASVGPGWPTDPDDPSLPAPMAHLRRSCTEAKELLSSETQATIPVLLPGVDATIRITREEFEARIRPAVDDSISAFEAAIVQSGVTPEQLDAVLLVGGSSRIPFIARQLQDRYGSLVAVDVDPVHAVARGAALFASGGMIPQANAAPLAPPSFPTPSDPASAAIASLWPADDHPPVAAAPTMPTPPPVVSFAEPPSLPVTEQPRPQAPASEPTYAPSPYPSTPTPVPTVDLASPQPKPNRKGLLVGVAALALLVAGGVGYVLTRDNGEVAADSGSSDGASDDGTSDDGTSDDGASDDTDGETDVAGATTLPPTGPASPEGMVEVAAGTYPLGLDKPESNVAETFTTSADLAAFHIDATEVSNADYKSFVDQTGAEPPAGWRAGAYPEDKADHPVQGVSFAWASAYCSALSKRLQTEAEWEAAARGTEARVWPWGDDVTAVTLPSEGTYPVGSVAGNVSPFGVFDMAGNVWEWVSDSYDQRVGEDRRVLRGGQNGYLRETVTRMPVNPVASSALTIAGFRCAASSVDPAVAAGTFGEFTAPEQGNIPEPEPLPAGVLVYDDFTDATSGWTEQAVAGEFRRGYHPNEYLHLETRAELKEALAIGPWKSDPATGFTLRTSAFAEPTLTSDSGTYAWGLAFNFDDKGDGLIFIVDERSEQWLICTRFLNDDGTPGYTLIEQATRSIPATAELEVVAGPDDQYQFKIGDAVIHSRSIPGYDGTGQGLILISYAGSEMVHIHFDEFQVSENR